MSRVATSVCILGGAVALVVAGVARSQSVLTGGAKTQVVASYQGTEPLPKPDQILVYDFTVPPDVITMDESAAARLYRRRAARMGSDDDSSPDVVARQARASFSKTLVSLLRKASMPTEMALGPDTMAPAHTLVVQGEFTAIDEGNKTKRVMIGLGRGASDVQAHVTVALTTGTQPIVLSEFKLKSESGKKPGAAATMGVGALAVGATTGAAGDRKATVEADASRMAKAVAKQIQALMAAQKWVPPQEPESE